MKTRKRSLESLSSSSQRSSNCKRKKMDEQEWLPHDRRLLTLLARVRDEEEVSLGTKADVPFYHKAAEKVSTESGVSITAHDIADRVRFHRSIFNDYKRQPEKYRHSNIQTAEYGGLLTRCFRAQKTLSVPGSLGCSRSASLATASSTARTQARVATDPKNDLEDNLARVLAHLHTQHALDAKKIMLFSALCGQNPVFTKVFLNLTKHADMINYINELGLGADCPELKKKEGNAESHASVPKPSTRMFHITTEEAKSNPNVMTGTFLINSIPVLVLFDTGASNSFIANEFLRYPALPHREATNSL